MKPATATITRAKVTKRTTVPLIPAVTMETVLFNDGEVATFDNGIRVRRDDIGITEEQFQDRLGVGTAIAINGIKCGGKGEWKLAYVICPHVLALEDSKESTDILTQIPIHRFDPVTSDDPGYALCRECAETVKKAKSFDNIKTQITCADCLVKNGVLGSVISLPTKPRTALKAHCNDCKKTFLTLVDDERLSAELLRDFGEVISPEDCGKIRAERGILCDDCYNKALTERTVIPFLN